MTGHRPGTDASNLAIRVANLSKCYQIYDRPQDRLKQSFLPRLRRLTHPFSQTPARNYYREFWALSDVSFEVKRGEAVGIIGRNGAGKSTLLQLIAGTLTPTSGSVEVSGRVAALLELGSGFNPEFTGRENVYLNASLLGLTTEETEAKFEEIAAFADIGDFIDQPVKNYSSGMLMRVAFAVQTAVEPSVLIVDEALSVGDLFFQAKCMARLNALRDQDVTLLFVSHDIGTVRQVCEKAILLDGGCLVADANAGEVADCYMRMQFDERNRATQSRAVERVAPVAQRASTPSREAGSKSTGSVNEYRPSQSQATFPASAFPLPLTVDADEHFLTGADAFRERAKFERTGNGDARYANVLMLKNGVPSDVFEFGDIVTLRQVVNFSKALGNLNVSYKIRTLQGVDVVFGDTRLQGAMGNTYEQDRAYVFDWTFELNLMHGRYTIMSGLNHPPAAPGLDWVYVDVVPICYQFTVLPRSSGMVDGLVVWENRLEISNTNAIRLKANGQTLS